MFFTFLHVFLTLIFQIQTVFVKGFGGKFENKSVEKRKTGGLGTKFAIARNEQGNQVFYSKNMMTIFGSIVCNPKQPIHVFNAETQRA